MHTDYVVGDSVRCVATMQNYLGSPAVHASVALLHRNPAGTVVTYVFPASVAALGSGIYETIVNLDLGGDHQFRYEATGTNQGAEEFSLHVRPSAVRGA